jgi:hypothetical protein
VDLKLRSGKLGVELVCDDEFILKMTDKFSDMNGIGTLLTQMPDILSNVMRMAMMQQMNKITREPIQGVAVPMPVGFGGRGSFTQGPDDAFNKMNEAFAREIDKQKKKKVKSKTKAEPKSTTMTGDYDIDVTLVNPDPTTDASRSPS